MKEARRGCPESLLGHRPPPLHQAHNPATCVGRVGEDWLRGPGTQKPCCPWDPTSRKQRPRLKSGAVPRETHRQLQRGGKHKGTGCVTTSAPRATLPGKPSPSFPLGPQLVLPQGQDVAKLSMYCQPPVALSVDTGQGRASGGPARSSLWAM